MHELVQNLPLNGVEKCIIYPYGVGLKNTLFLKNIEGIDWKTTLFLKNVFNENQPNKDIVDALGQKRDPFSTFFWDMLPQQFMTPPGDRVSDPKWSKIMRFYNPRASRALERALTPAKGLRASRSWCVLGT